MEHGILGETSAESPQNGESGPRQRQKLSSLPLPHWLWHTSPGTHRNLAWCQDSGELGTASGLRQASPRGLL